MGESEHLPSTWLWNFTKYQITCSLLPGHPDHSLTISLPAFSHAYKDPLPQGQPLLSR